MKILTKLFILWGVLMGGKAPHAEKWAF